MKKYNFSFAGTALSGFCGVTTKRPPREVALYDGTLQDIPGRSGSEFIDNKRYKNVPFTREIGFAKHSYSHIDDLVEMVIDWLAYLHGYQEFEDTDHPGMVTFAVLTNFGEIQTLLRKYHTATLKFSRVPFWYEKDGLKEKVLTDNLYSGITLHNRYRIESKPIVKVKLYSTVTSSNAFTLRYNGAEDYIYRWSDLPLTTEGGALRRFITIDFENEETLMSTSESGGDAEYIDVGMPLGFTPGPNSVSVFGGYNSTVESLSIIPRWRCL